MNYKRILALLITMGILLPGTGQVTGQQDEPQSPQGTHAWLGFHLHQSSPIELSRKKGKNGGT